MASPADAEWDARSLRDCIVPRSLLHDEVGFMHAAYSHLSASSATAASRSVTSYAVRAMNDTIRVLIASDVRLYRDGLVSALQSVAGFTIISAVSAMDVVVATRHARPDLVVLDLAAPRRLALLRELAALEGPAVVVLALENSSDEVLACVEAGARGYLTRDGSLDELVATLRSVARGEMLCSPDVAALLVRRLADLSAMRFSSVYTPLTQRELEIVSLLERRLTNKSIAATLGIELATVKNHIHNILSKLHVRRRSDVTASLRGGADARDLPGRDVAPRPRH